MTPVHPHAQPHPHEVRQPSMADLWHEFPAEPGLLAPAVAQHVAMHAPIAPVHVEHVVAPAAPRRGYREPIAWHLIKHSMQAAFVLSVVLFVTSGADAPVMGLAYAATGLMLMGIIAVTDRQMFVDGGEAIQLVELVHQHRHELQEQAARPRFHPSHTPGSAQWAAAPLSPLVEQMHVVMPTRVDVT